MTDRLSREQELFDLIRQQQSDDRWGHRVDPEPGRVPFWDIDRIVDDEGETTIVQKAKFLSGRKVKRIRARGSVPHGDHIRYASGCRCEACKSARAEHGKTKRRAVGIEAKSPPSHGTASGYQKLKCRCPDCRAAWSHYMREYRNRAREAA